MSRLPFLLPLLVACVGDKDETGLPGTDEVAVCEAEHLDGYDLDGLAVTGDDLEISVGYGGGCEEHTWQLCWGGTFMESDPVQVALTLGHDANNDSCQAYLSETLVFGLEPLKQSWIDAYGASTGTIVINLDGGSTSYSF